MRTTLQLLLVTALLFVVSAGELDAGGASPTLIMTEPQAIFAALGGIVPRAPMAVVAQHPYHLGWWCCRQFQQGELIPKGDYPAKSIGTTVNSSQNLILAWGLEFDGVALREPRCDSAFITEPSASPVSSSATATGRYHVNFYYVTGLINLANVGECYIIADAYRGGYVVESLPILVYLYHG